MESIEQAKKIYEMGVVSAKAGKTLTYREVLNSLGYDAGVNGHAIRYGLELTWIACAHYNLPILTSIIVNKTTGKPSEGGYPLANWGNDTRKVFAYKSWLSVNSINWDYVWANRVILSDTHGTGDYWTNS